MIIWLIRKSSWKLVLIFDTFFVGQAFAGGGDLAIYGDLVYQLLTKSLHDNKCS